MKTIDLSKLKPIPTAQRRQPVFRISRSGLYISKPFAEKYNLKEEKKIVLFEYDTNSFVIASYENLDAVPYQLRSCIVNLMPVRQIGKNKVNVSAFKIDSKIFRSKYFSDKKEIETEKIDISGQPALLCKI